MGLLFETALECKECPASVQGGIIRLVGWGKRLWRSTVLCTISTCNDQVQPGKGLSGMALANASIIVHALGS